MFEYLSKIDPFVLAILAGLFTFSITTLGSSLVFFFKSINDNTLTIMLGVSSGVMIAASFWSLLSPAIELNSSISRIPWLIPTIGFIFGGLLIIISDKFFSKITKDKNTQRNFLLTTAVSLHNFPEGLAIGFAFGALNHTPTDESIVNAIILAIGIGIQNFPEGACISIPLNQSGNGKLKSFFIGSLSGVLEIIGVIIGAIFSSITKNILPLMLSFSAGAMIAVSASELIPDAFSKNKNLACLGLIIGFAFMMFLDVSLS